LNVPAFKAAVALGVAPIVEMGHKFGFTDINGTYGPSIAIGGIDLKALDLAYGYSVLANGGAMVGQDTFAPVDAQERLLQPVSILQVVDGDRNVRFNINDHRRTERIVEPQYASMITTILTDPSARCIIFGCGGLTVPGYQVAVKTGTSEPFTQTGANAGKIGETWAFGYTPDLVVGVWAGNADNAPIDHIFSTSISFRAMRDILLEAYHGRPETPFPLANSTQ
jgi:membrane peptidoglycan carboxypeptidase